MTLLIIIFSIFVIIGIILIILNRHAEKTTMLWFGTIEEENTRQINDIIKQGTINEQSKK